MGWVLRLVETGVENFGRSIDVMEIIRPGDLGNLADLGLTLLEGRRLLALVQQEIIAAQSRNHAAQRPMCRFCGATCQVKDYRPHQIATLFGQVTVRLPRFRCAGCGGMDGASTPYAKPCGRAPSRIATIKGRFIALCPTAVDCAACTFCAIDSAGV